MPGGRMTAHFPRTLLAIVVAMTLSACGGTVAPTGGPASVDQTPPPSSTTAPTPSATIPSSAPSAAGTPSPDASGLARNGVIAYNDGAGDIYSLDPATGVTKLLVGGPNTDVGPDFLPDGRHFTFFRVEEGMAYLANANGTGATSFGRGDWSPRGDRIAAISDDGDLTMIEVASGRRDVFTLTKPVGAVRWLTEDVLLLIEDAEGGGAAALSTINVDGTNQMTIETPFLCCGTSTIQGRGIVAWTSWDNATGATGRIHVLDTASGQDRLLASTDVPGFHFLNPRLSPDGKWLTVTRIQAHVDGAQLALIAADGSGKPIGLGPRQPTNSAEIHSAFSPDGTQLLVTYDDGSAWLFDLPAGTGEKTDWQGLVEITWQGVDPTP